LNRTARGLLSGDSNRSSSPAVHGFFGRFHLSSSASRLLGKPTAGEVLRRFGRARAG
jgi:hypothetical protein